MKAPMTPEKLRFITTVIAVDIILFLFMLDQITKWYVVETLIKPLSMGTDVPQADFLTWLLALRHDRVPFGEIMVIPHFNLVMVWNTGVSFGVFAGHPAAATGFLMAALGAIVIGFGIWMFRTQETFLRFVLAAIIGGALGNLWDRVRFGAVADFLDFYYGGWHYPAFNVADSCIVLGILALIGYELFYRSRVQQPTSIKGHP